MKRDPEARMLSDRRRRLRAHASPGSPELALAALAAVLVLLALAPLTAQAGLGIVLEGTAAWPRSERLVAATVAAWRGDWGVGLGRQEVGAPVGMLWSATALVVAAQVVVAATCWSAVRSTQGGRHGLASRAQARTALGGRALRRRTRVIRPDRHHAFPRLLLRRLRVMVRRLARDDDLAGSPFDSMSREHER